MARKKKSLSADDVALWQKVTQSVEPLNEPVQMDSVLETFIPAIPAKQAVLMQTTAPREPAKRTRTVQQTPSIFQSTPAPTSPNMDKKNFKKLVQGRKEIDATLDLHGMTSAQAQSTFTRFISQGSRMGLRLVLVITGKGNKTHMDEFNRPRSGVLKSSLPDWVRSAGLSDKVLQVTPAQQKHGGGGAFYVYLRRSR